MKNKVEWSGSGTLIDSYRSSHGLYNADQHGTRAVVTVNAIGNNKIVLSSGSIIYGDAYIGPGGDIDKGIKTSGGSQITGLRSTLEQPVSIPDLSAPTGPPFSGSHEGNLDLWGSMTQTISSNRYFNRITLWDSSKVIISGNVTVLLNARLELGDNAEVQILAGSSLKLYVRQNVNVWTNAKINGVTKDPTKFHLYMIGNNHSLNMADAPAMYGVVENPKGTANIWDSAQVFGKIRAKQLNGDGQIHVDRDCDFE
jgi:hypothetical protein